MSDITMCMGSDANTMIQCPWRNKCHRHNAKPSKFRQSYFMGMPGHQEQGDGWMCEAFWESRVGKQASPERAEP